MLIMLESREMKKKTMIEISGISLGSLSEILMFEMYYTHIPNLLVIILCYSVGYSVWEISRIRLLDYYYPNESHVTYTVQFISGVKLWLQK